MPEALFNISRFLLIKTQDKQFDGVSQLTITYALMKQARLLGANKLGMQLLERLRGMKIPKHLLAQIESWAITAKAYPYRDPEELLPLCYRCSTFNTLLPTNNTPENSCVQCGLKFQHSFVMFGNIFIFSNFFNRKKFRKKYSLLLQKIFVCFLYSTFYLFSFF